MGRIRNDFIRGITDDLLSKYPIDSFTERFQDNKEKLKELPEEFPSKKILNRVAGNITNLFKKKQKEMKSLLEESSRVDDEEDYSEFS
jgi:ribosomal protein S17E